MTSTRLRPAPVPAAIHRASNPWRLLAATYLLLSAATALAAMIASRGASLVERAPHDALPARPDVAVDLLAHNAPVALWPLALAALGWATIPVARRVGDALIATHLLAHAALVGGALGAQPATWRYLPHLPLEWLALALPATAWLAARRGRPPHLVVSASGTVASLGLAALLETYATPV